jgi:1-acyl-sn-glycerol-3-phosphate acyltransferase
MLRRRRAERTEFPWWYVLIEGIIGLGFGLALMFAPITTLDAIFSLLGAYWMAVSALALVIVVTPYGAGRRLTLLIRGLIGLIGGFLLFNLPNNTSLTNPSILANLVGVMGIVVGLVGLLQAVKGGGWGAAILGAISIFLGVSLLGSTVVVLLNFIWFIGLLTAVGGLLGLLLALRLRNHPEEGTLGVAGIRNPTMGIWRIFALFVLLIVAVVAIFIAWLIPVRRQGVRLHYWMVTWVCQAANWILAVDVTCADAATLRAHTGLVFANHVSYLDISTIVSLEPLRFLSAAEIFKIPFVGWVADSISTVFVERQNRASRASTRDSIARAVESTPIPPFVVFPEGRMGTPTELQPFHYGSFAIACETGVAYLPVALRYNPAEIATWRGVKYEPFIASFWRLVTHRGRVAAEVIPLTPVHPGPDDRAPDLAHAAQRAIEHALGLAPAPLQLAKHPAREANGS